MSGTALDPGLPAVTGELPWPPDQSIRYLSLWQPWASAIPAGLKAVETRGRRTHFRGWLMIHAAQHRLTKKDRTEVPYGVLRWYDEHLDSLPFGAVVAVARVADCFPTEQVRPIAPVKLKGLVWHARHGQGLDVRPNELLWGGYTAGRFAWPLANVVTLPVPVPMKGSQGIKTPPVEVLEAVLEQIKNGARRG